MKQGVTGAGRPLDYRASQDGSCVVADVVATSQSPAAGSPAPGAYGLRIGYISRNPICRNFRAVYKQGIIQLIHLYLSHPAFFQQGFPGGASSCGIPGKAGRRGTLVGQGITYTELVLHPQLSELSAGLHEFRHAAYFPYALRVCVCPVFVPPQGRAPRRVAMRLKKRVNG